MKKTKIISLVTAFVMLVSITSGCANNSKSTDTTAATTSTSAPKTTTAVKGPDYLNMTGFPLVNQPKSLTVMVNNSSYQPDFNEVAMWKAYKK